MPATGGGRGETGLPMVGRPAGLLEKLVAVVRPPFRAEVLAFDPRDPVFGAPPCAVPDCGRPRRQRGLCTGHVHRWREHGYPDLAEFTAGANPQFWGQMALQRCIVDGCGFGHQGHGLCPRHYHRWLRVGRPPLPGWAASPGPAPAPSPVPPPCRVGGCRLWAHPGSQWCFQHRKRWIRRGQPDPEAFVDQMAEHDEFTGERIDLRRLPTPLRLEIAYVLQCRSDEGSVRLIPWQLQRIINALAGTGLHSLLAVSEDDWTAAGPAPQLKKRLGALAFLRDAYRRVEALAVGQGWDVEYPRTVWRLHNLGRHEQVARLDFTPIGQLWLRELAKRWAHRQLTTGLSVATTYNSLRAVTWLAGWLARPSVAVDRPADIDRALLERLLGDARLELPTHSRYVAVVAGLAGFLRAIHQYGWDTNLPAGAQLYPEDYPSRPQRLPRGLPDTVMAQVEAPANLDRWTDPALRLITLILIRTGLRISSAVGLPFDCMVTDTDGAPYLRYWNTKMKREALVPIDEEVQHGIGEQQRRVLVAFPAGTPVLFPRVRANLDGTKPLLTQTYRDALVKWLAACDMRDEHGRPVHLTPHQWRHTLGTTLINRDVPQQVVQKILDHDSAEMTAHYARLSDTTVRRHWETARKVNHRGETVTLDPDGPLAEAAWAKHRLAHATQALPNGYCGLPLIKTCQHANACLTCPLFITTAEFLPQHREQHRQTLQIISTAQARGQARMVEMNQQVADNLQRIIATLETDDHGDPTSGQVVTDAS